MFGSFWVSVGKLWRSPRSWSAGTNCEKEDIVRTGGGSWLKALKRAGGAKHPFRKFASVSYRHECKQRSKRAGLLGIFENVPLGEGKCKKESVHCWLQERSRCRAFGGHLWRAADVHAPSVPVTTAISSTHVAVALSQPQFCKRSIDGRKLQRGRSNEVPAPSPQEKVATKVRVLHHETAFLRGVPSLILRTAAPSLTKFAIHSGEPLILGLKVTAIVTKRYLFTCLLSLLLSSLVVDRNRRWTASPKLVLSDAEAYANPHSRSHGVFSSTRLLKP